MKFLWSAIALLSIVFGSTDAFAKKGSRRDGFTFGSTFRLIESNEPSIATNAGGKSKRALTESQTVRPHVGYVFGNFFHLGIDATFESEKREEALNGQRSNEKIEVKEDTSMRGAGLVTRLLFGEIMYFEAGLGYYERRTVVENRYVTDLGNDQFSGTKEDFKTRSAGMGYHLGGGIEFPMAYGFFFTGDYLVHYYQLRPYRTDTKVQRDSEAESRREFNFGISYYY